MPLREPPAASPGDRSDAEVAEQLSALNSVVILAVILSQASRVHQVIRLVTTAIPSVARCDVVWVWRASAAGDYYDQAPDELRAQLARPSLGPRQLEIDSYPWACAYPLTGPSGDDPVHLVLAGAAPLPDEENFLVSLLAQLCGTVIAKLESIANERAVSLQLAEQTRRLEATVETLTKVMAVHRSLNKVAAAGGEEGIAISLHRLTGFPVLIQDVHGNTRACAGDVDGVSADKVPADQRRDLIRRLARQHRATHVRGHWLVLANPRVDVVGVIALVDPLRRATETDLAALEYAGTVLSVELARLQSVAEAELRSSRDFAEELLAGADEATVQESAHRFGYDANQPHRVLVLVGRPRDDADENLFHAVARHVRDLDVGTLVVTRSDSVIVIANRDVDWSRLHTAIVGDLRGGSSCRIAVGSRYPHACRVAESYREAQFVADLAAAVDGPAKPVQLFETLGAYRILSSVTDLAGAERFMTDQLAALIDYDRCHNGELVRTVATYLDAGANLDPAAAALCVHRNTLKYRLRRVREISGHDLADGSTRLDLHLATKIWFTMQTVHRGRGTS